MTATSCPRRCRIGGIVGAPKRAARGGRGVGLEAPSPSSSPPRGSWTSIPSIRWPRGSTRRPERTTRTWRRTSPTGDERHNKRRSGHSGRQPQRRVSSPPVGTIPTASDVTDTPNPNSKPRRGSATDRDDRAGRALAARQSERPARRAAVISSRGPERCHAPAFRAPAPSQPRACRRRRRCGRACS